MPEPEPIADPDEVEDRRRNERLVLWAQGLMALIVVCLVLLSVLKWIIEP